MLHRLIAKAAVAVGLGAMLALPAVAQQVLIRNVNIFNGTDNKLISGQDVLIEGELIKSIGRGLSASPDTKYIDGAGRTLMPGLIDGHAHVMINQNFGTVETNLDLTDISYNAAIVMKRFLMDGFTTVRDMGGPAFGLARAIDQGRVVGSRLYPSGAALISMIFCNLNFI